MPGLADTKKNGGSASSGHRRHFKGLPPGVTFWDMRNPRSMGSCSPAVKSCLLHIPLHDLRHPNDLSGSHFPQMSNDDSTCFTGLWRASHKAIPAETLRLIWEGLLLDMQTGEISSLMGLIILKGDIDNPQRVGG